MCIFGVAIPHPPGVGKKIVFNLWFQTNFQPLPKYTILYPSMLKVENWKKRDQAIHLMFVKLHFKAVDVV